MGRATNPRGKTRKTLQPCAPLPRSTSGSVRQFDPTPVPNQPKRRLPAEASGPNDRPPLPSPASPVRIRPRNATVRRAPFSTAFSLRFASIRFGSVRFGSVRFDSDRFGSTRIGSVRFGRSSRRSRWIVPLFFRVSLCGKIGGNFPWKGKDPGRRGRGAWQGEESDARSSLHRSSLLKPGVNRERKREREIGCEAWGSWIESSFESFFRFLLSCPCLFSCGEAGEGVLQGLASSRRQVILVFLFFLLPPLLLLFL